MCNVFHYILIHMQRKKSLSVKKKLLFKKITKWKLCGNKIKEVLNFSQVIFSKYD